MYRRSSQYTDVVNRFLSLLISRGYLQTPAAPLTAGDVSVTFVNATITPFKDRIVAGEPLRRTCQYQECLRASGSYPWLYTFGMVGALVDGEYLDEVCTDATAALLAALGTDRAERLGALIDNRDTDLVAAMAPVAREQGLTVVLHDGCDIESWWTYGAQYPMSGRGLTFLYRHHDQPCSPACRPGCDCGRWQEIGNIIVVSAPDRGYVEVGIGVETLLSTKHGGNLYLIPEIRSAQQALVADGWSPEQAAELLNLHRAIERLTADGSVPGPRGAGYVLRRMAALLDELHSANPRVAAAAEYATAMGAPPAAVDMLAAEAERRQAGRRQRLLSAATLLRRRPATTDERLRETYGLSEHELSEVRHA